MKNTIIIFVIVVVVIGVGAFYGGVQYGKSQATSAASQDRQQRATGQGGVPGGGQFNRAGRGGGFVNGDIIAKDDKSLTIKLPDGNGQAGSKIVFLSDSTQVSKFTAGSIADLAVGQSVMVNGTTNADGSITAQMIQLRPARPEGAASSSTPR